MVVRSLSFVVAALAAWLAGAPLQAAPSGTDPNSHGGHGDSRGDATSAQPNNGPSNGAHGGPIFFNRIAPNADAASRGWDDPKAIRPDPNVRAGVLPNGLRYWIRSNPIPTKALSLRFVIQAGSYQESPEERGAAHFLEHMAFNGTTHIAPGRIDTLFGEAGVQFGRDQNAETGYFDTRYEVDLPQIDDAKVDMAFQWLRDIGDGLTLDPAAVDRERGVVIAEDERTHGPERDWTDRVDQFLSPELRSTDHDPIGTPASLKAIGPETLRRFHDRWYRPDDALLIVVGDLPAGVLEQRVKDAFGSWKAEGPPPQRVPYTHANLSRGLDVLTLGSPSLPSAVSFCWGHADDEDGPDTLARERLKITRRLWRDILNQRLRLIAGDDHPPFGRAEAANREAPHEALYSCMDALPLKDDWKGALAAVEGEARRMALHGVTAEETKHTEDVIRAEHRADAQSADSRPTVVWAERMMGSAIRGDTIASPEERYAVFEVAAKGLDAQTVGDAFRRDWAGAGPFVVVTTPNNVQAAEVRGAWQVAAASTPPDVSARANATWAYSDFGPAGKVVDRQVVEKPGFTRVRFANGVVLNYKRITTVQDDVKIAVRFGAGRREIPNDDFFAAEMGAQLLIEGGLGKHDIETVRRMFSDHGWSAKLNIFSEAFVLSGETNPVDLETETQILAAYMTDPGFRRSLDAKLPTLFDLMMRETRTSADQAANQALYRTISPQAVYVTPSPAKLATINSATFERLLKPALTQAPIEVTIVGDLDEDTAIEDVAKTFGALPPRTSTPRERAGTFFLRYPESPPPLIRTAYESSTDRAQVTLIWPLYVANPKQRREEYALNIVANVLNDAVRRRVRGEMGKSYAPQVTMDSPDAADQGAMTADIETTAADADAVADAARKTALDLAQNGISEEAFEAARKPVLAQAATHLQDSDWWLGGLDGSAGNYEILREFVDWDADMGSVTLADANRWAKVWLSRPPIVVIATPKPPSAGQRAATMKEDRAGEP